MTLLTTASAACLHAQDDATPTPTPGPRNAGRTAGARRGTFDGLDLNLLRVFAALMRERNVTRAGAALCLSQSAVSNSLQRLRTALGDMLFERTASGIRPTSHGLELWHQLQPHYLQIEKVLTPEAFDPLTYEGAFTIAMSDYTAERIMPRLGAYLETHAPRVQINLLPYSVANMFPMFEREGIDLAIGANRDDAQHARGLRASTLWPVHSRCLMRRDHPLAQGELTMKRFLSARHVPDDVVQVEEIPRTLSGKKMEVPLRKLLLGTPAEKVASPDSMQNPRSLAFFVDYAGKRAAA